MKKPEIIKFCAFCNDQFIASRPTASFCSNTCRTKACVKRKQDEQAKTEQEAIHQQEMELLKQKTDARRLKREQKTELQRQEQEKQAEIDRQAKEAKRIQDEQDAAALAVKKRKDEEDRQKLKEKQNADEKQRRENKERIKKLMKERNDKKNQHNRNLMLGKSLLILGAGALFYQAFIKPKEKTSQTAELPKPDGFSKIDLSTSPLKEINQTDKATGPSIRDEENTI